MDVLKTMFTSGVYYHIMADGGEDCMAYMSMEYRILVNIVMTIVYVAYILMNLNPKQTEKEEKLEIPQESSLLEKLFGKASILVIMFQIFCKAYSGQLIFIFNPCHLILVLQIILLLTMNHTYNKTLFIVVINCLFSPMIGVVFPATNGLTFPFEYEMFFIEHYLGAFINPIILVSCGRYNHTISMSFQKRLIAHSYFGLYQRLFLFPLSYLTYANLNYTLCASDIDPIVPYISQWYYLLADGYILIMGLITSSIMYIILSITQFFTNKIEAGIKKII